MKKSVIFVSLAVCLIGALMFGCSQPKRFSNEQEVAKYYNSIDMQVTVTGISANPKLTDRLTPWTGNPMHDGQIWLRTSANSSRAVPMTWDPNRKAYVATLKMTAEQKKHFWVSVYCSARAILAPPGDIEPVIGGVFLETKRNDSSVLRGKVELVHLVSDAIFTQIGSGQTDKLLQYEITGINPATYCAEQGPDNRLQVLGFDTPPPTYVGIEGRAIVEPRVQK